jgi:hypothetical protein
MGGASDMSRRETIRRFVELAAPPNSRAHAVTSAFGTLADVVRASEDRPRWQ